MSKTLVIVESPAKAKTISRFLGRSYIVKSSMGHVRDLPKSQFGVDVNNGFEPKYITIRGKGKILKELRSAAQKSANVLLAPDPDREGEAIAWHLQHALNLEDGNRRIEFNEITKNAVKKAVGKPRKIDYNRVNAQQARRILDRLVGYNLSPLLWKKVRKGLSAGRVQSVAVRLICDRDEEIEKFEPQEYWTIEAGFNSDPVLWSKLLKKDGKKPQINKKQEADAILEELQEKGLTFVVKHIKKLERKRKPAAPFITSTLQQEAYNKLNFGSRKTMRIAQQLYEGIDLGKEAGGATGLITYIRTDSTRLSQEHQKEAREFIKSEYGKEYLPGEGPLYRKSKKAQVQDAHEAIRPTSVKRQPEEIKSHLTQDQYKLYRLIWERTIASQMQAATLEVTTIDIEAGKFLFRASGTNVKFPGFRRIYIEGEKSNSRDALKNELPQLKEGTNLGLKELKPYQHFTQPPPRYSEASLIKTMERLGIGRPSTYAPTIDTILSRGYVKKENKQFLATDLGKIVVNLLKDYFPEIIEIEFTADMEERLDLIEKGELEWRAVIRSFYEPFYKVLKKAEEEIGPIKIENEETNEECEKCGRKLVIKRGRYGKFMACPGFPECKNIKPLLENIGISCPYCGGDIVSRRSKKGKKFFGCSNYPDCDYVSWNKPTEKECPQCGARLVEKKVRNKEVQIMCPSCNYRLQMKEA